MKYIESIIVNHSVIDCNCFRRVEYNLGIKTNEWKVDSRVIKSLLKERKRIDSKTKR